LLNSANGNQFSPDKIHLNLTNS